MTYRQDIRFLLNDREVSLDTVGADDTVLDFLRIDRRLTGTKEGCAEGDCGACTVLVGRIDNGALRYEAVNACIRFLASLDGCHIVTIEHLVGPDGALHPVQQAMVDYHGSQCGFCTPGFVMSLYALWMENPTPTEAEVESAVQGNLCRCTGYEPIIRAALAVSRYGTPTRDFLVAQRNKIAAKLTALDDGRTVAVRRKCSRAFLPANSDDLAEILAANPGATIVAGSTDVGLWVTKMMRWISPAIFIGNLRDLKEIHLTDDALTLGAGVTYTESQQVIGEAFPHLTAFWDRIAGWQVRNMGTIGGNIANGSPIGDTPPVLIALDATITLRKGAERRHLPLEDFFIAYGKQDRDPAEFVECIAIPREPGGLHAAYKISKRRDEDISSVCAAFNLRVEESTITGARIAFGGMAATPKRASSAEAALIGQPWSEATLVAASRALTEDFTPLTDMRASSDYRMRVAQNLFRRFYLDHVDAAPAPLMHA
ncbi:xanthine dehydrogenase small subunit [Aliiruegeria haliotis]|uniref:Xanthine dehydrogenase small subunit n=1 Tax=Aliiruegeria haliotis TaxID=1280846 RepID=A0A2T0RM36_9RHOB|nr:xanthine dehydrogenase small subunit [Aliiruegeria haliotis]PRY22228.1 xanthine dehydrogenase small subunit [Aliiruegeria haliotis]